MADRDWDAHYASGELPWDTGEPDPRLVEAVESGTIPVGRALEVGCGTGTNARWLAERGFDVLGLDLAPLAIEAARAKRPRRDGCVFEVADFLTGDGPEGPFDFVFDRGVFHVFDEADRRAEFASRVAAALRPGGLWLSLIGSTEGPPRDHGPPRRSAREVLDAIEPSVELVSLRSIVFDADAPTPPKAWAVLSRRRAIEAQPSSRH